MKFNISTAILLRYLAPCAEVPSSRSPSAFGTCVLLDARKSQVTIRAYNLPLSIRATITGDSFTVSLPGMVAVPAAEFLKRIKEIKDDVVTLSSDGVKLTIKGTGARKYTLGCYSGEEFPAFPQRPSDEVTVPGDSLASVLRRTLYAVHDDASMPMFCGIALSAANDTLTASATDGRRIARATAPIVGAIDTFVPAVAATTLLTMIDKGDVRVASSKLLVSCTVDGIELVYLRPDSDVPGYDQVFSGLKANDGPRLDRRAMIATLKGVTVDGASGNVPIELASDGNVIRLRNMSNDGNESSDEIACASNHKWKAYAEAMYLLDALRSLEGDDVDICVFEADTTQPIVLRSGSGIATIGRVAPAKAKEAA